MGEWENGRRLPFSHSPIPLWRSSRRFQEQAGISAPGAEPTRRSLLFLERVMAVPARLLPLAGFCLCLAAVPVRADLDIPLQGRDDPRPPAAPAPAAPSSLAAAPRDAGALVAPAPAPGQRAGKGFPAAARQVGVARRGHPP